MNPETVAALNRITRRFYDKSAYGFAVTHEAPRPGWRQVLEAVAPAWNGLPELSVLDVGCGNGRFGRFCRDFFKRPIRYYGLDASPALVELAAAGLSDLEAVTCAPFDFVEDSLDTLLQDQTFTLVVAFGVLHHVPHHSRRRALLEQLCRRIAPGGALACSIWRAQHPEQARHEMVSWEEYNLRSREPVEIEQLESGDNLVMRRGDAARYCHYVDDAEAVRLFDGLPADRIETFVADGRAGTLNRYVLLRKALASPA